MRWLVALAALGLGVGLAAAVALVALVALRRRVIVATVDGPSMEPTFLSGECVLVRRRRLADLRHGDVIVVRPPAPDSLHNAPPDEHFNLKRVVALPGDPVPDGVPTSDVATVPAGALVVFGDNSGLSTDSRQRGFYYGDQVFGVVVRKLSQPTQR